MDTQANGTGSAAFQEVLQEWKDSKNYAPLMDIDIAMWPEAVAFANDISDREQFNERFIESRFGFQDIVEKAYLASFWHSFVFILCTTTLPFHPEIWWGLLFIDASVALLFALLLRALTLPSGRVRFNRQAQLVHYHWGRELITVPWREVQPLVKAVYLPNNVTMRLIFPTPPEIKSWKKAALYIEGTFDWVDEMGIHDCANRFEFIRRYMEKGLDSITPKFDQKLEKFSAFPGRNWLFYYAGLGWLIDRWAARCRARFRWPEEVERLCAEGADLSDYDTTPVAASPNVFFRYDIREGTFYTCDRHGNRFAYVTN